MSINDSGIINANKCSYEDAVKRVYYVQIIQIIMQRRSRTPYIQVELAGPSGSRATIPLFLAKGTNKGTNKSTSRQPLLHQGSMSPLVDRVGSPSRTLLTPPDVRTSLIDLEGEQRCRR